MSSHINYSYIFIYLCVWVGGFLLCFHYTAAAKKYDQTENLLEARGSSSAPHSPCNSNKEWRQHYIRTDQIFISVCSSCTTSPAGPVCLSGCTPARCSTERNTEKNTLRENCNTERHKTYVLYLPMISYLMGCWWKLWGSHSEILKDARRRL